MVFWGGWGSKDHRWCGATTVRSDQNVPENRDQGIQGLQELDISSNQILSCSDLTAAAVELIGFLLTCQLWKEHKRTFVKRVASRNIEHVCFLSNCRAQELRCSLDLVENRVGDLAGVTRVGRHFVKDNSWWNRTFVEKEVDRDKDRTEYSIQLLWCANSGFIKYLYV